MQHQYTEQQIATLLDPLKVPESLTQEKSPGAALTGFFLDPIFTDSSSPWRSVQDKESLLHMESQEG